MPIKNVRFLSFTESNHQNTVLFSSSGYLKSLKGEVISYSALDSSSEKQIMSIHFQIIDKQAISLKNAPFGGFDFLNEVNTQILEDFVAFIISDLKEKKIKLISIKIPCSFYDTCHTFLQESVLLSLGFKNQHKEINHHIKITDKSLSSSMHPMEIRKLKKCTNAGFQFRIEDQSYLEQLYEFISICKKEKDHPHTIMYDQLSKTIQLIPESYKLFSVWDKKKIVAASVCVQVTKKVLYNFYPASLASYNNYSPIVFLLSNIYAYCQQHEYEILDLGTSMLKNQPNQTLANFKKNMSGILSEKKCFHLKLL